MKDFKGRIVHPQNWPEDLDYTRQDGRRHRLGFDGGNLDPGDRRRVRPCHDAAALADVLQDRPQCDPDRRRIARSSASTRRGSTRSCARRSCTSSRCSPAVRSPSRRPSSRNCSPQSGRIWGPTTIIGDPLHAALPAMAAAHRVHSRRRLPGGDPRRQGLGRHRRNRELHRDRHPAEVRRGSRSRHHRHGHRLQSQCAGRHRLQRSTASRWSFPTRSPIAA